MIRPRQRHEEPLAWAAMWAAHDLGMPTSTDFRTNFHLYSRYYGLSWLSPLILRTLRGFHNRGQCTYVPTTALQQQLANEGFTQLEVIGRRVDTERMYYPSDVAVGASIGALSAWGILKLF